MQENNKTKRGEMLRPGRPVQGQGDFLLREADDGDY
jgi:hypothetical protein